MAIMQTINKNAGREELIKALGLGDLMIKDISLYLPEEGPAMATIEIYVPIEFNALVFDNERAKKL